MAENNVTHDPDVGDGVCCWPPGRTLKVPFSLIAQGAEEIDRGKDNLLNLSHGTHWHNRKK